MFNRKFIVVAVMLVAIFVISSTTMIEDSDADYVYLKDITTYNTESGVKDIPETLHDLSPTAVNVGSGWYGIEILGSTYHQLYYLEVTGDVNLVVPCGYTLLIRNYVTIDGSLKIWSSGSGEAKVEVADQMRDGYYTKSTTGIDFVNDGGSNSLEVHTGINLEVWSGTGGAAIGPSNLSSSGTVDIKIAGGKVTAHGSQAGIGACSMTSSCSFNLTVSGDAVVDVECTGSDDDNAMGIGGYTGSYSYYPVSVNILDNAKVTVSAPNTIAIGDGTARTNINIEGGSLVVNGATGVYCNDISIIDGSMDVQSGAIYCSNLSCDRARLDVDGTRSILSALKESLYVEKSFVLGSNPSVVFASSVHYKTIDNGNSIYFVGKSGKVYGSVDIADLHDASLTIPEGYELEVATGSMLICSSDNKLTNYGKIIIDGGDDVFKSSYNASTSTWGLQNYGTLSVKVKMDGSATYDTTSTTVSCANLISNVDFEFKTDATHSAHCYGGPTTVLFDGTPDTGRYPITATDVNSAYDISSGNTVIDISGNIAITARPIDNSSSKISISGEAKYGGTVSATYSGSQINLESCLTYQWYCDGVVISGATGKEYTIGVNAGSTLTVVATASGNYNGSMTSSGVVVQPGVLTGTIGISGDVVYNKEVSATYEGNATELTYLWYSNGQPISGANFETYTITVDAGSILTVSVTASGNYVGTLSSAESTVASNKTLPDDFVVTVTGDFVYGGTLTAHVENLPEGCEVVRYQWATGNTGRYMPVGTNSDTYTITSDVYTTYFTNINQKRVHVTVSVSGNYEGSVVSSSTLIQPAQIEGTVSIVGEPVYGETVTASFDGPMSGLFEGVSYQWLYNGTEIVGATSDTYTVTEDAGGQLSVRVTPARYSNYTGSLDSDAVTVLPAEITGTVVVEGDAIYTKTVSASYRGDATGLTYQWYSGDTPIEGATGKTYAISIDAGSTLTVMIAASGNYEGTKTSAGVLVQPQPIEGTLTLTGEAVFGATVTALYEGNCTDGQISWYRDGAYVTTASSYIVSSSDIGCKIMAAVISQSGNWSGAVYAYVGGSGSTVDPDGPGSDPYRPGGGDDGTEVEPGDPTGDVMIVGSLTYGEKAVADYIVPAGSTASYQWYYTSADGAESIIEGATSPEYVIGVNVGGSIRVEVTVTGDFEGTLSSQSKSVLPAAISGILKVDGEAVFGQTVTASYSGNCSDPSVSWFRDGVVIGTGDGYAITSDDIGCKIMAAVTSASGNWSGAVYAYVGGSGGVDPVGPGDDGYKPGYNDGEPVEPAEIDGTVTIDDAVYGRTAVALYDGGATGIAYQWFYNGQPIDGATGSSYRVTVDAGGILSVRVTASGDYNGSIESSVTVQPEAIDGKLTLTGEASVGEIVTAGYVGNCVDHAIIWYRDGIEIGVGDSHVITSEDVGHTLMAAAISQSGNWSGAVYAYLGGSDGVDPVGPGDGGYLPGDGGTDIPSDPMTGTVTVSGEAIYGRMVTAVYEGEVTEVTYQWMCDGTAIEGATSPSYTIMVDAGSILSVRVSAAGGSGSIDSEPVEVEPEAISGSLVLEGSAVSGTSASASYDGNCLDPEISWYRDGTLIAMGSEYAIVSDDVGHRLMAAVTSGSGNWSGAVYAYVGGSGSVIDPVGPGGDGEYTPGDSDDGDIVVPGGTTGSVSVFGEAIYGRTAMAVYDGDTTGIGYQWLCDGKAIEGATSQSYTIMVDAGSMLSVSVTSISAGTIISEQVEVKPESINGTIALTGEVVSGGELAASYSGNCADPAMTWYKDGAVVATGDGYTINSEDLGHKLMVAVTSESGNWSGAVYAYVSGSSGVDPVGPGSEDNPYLPGDGGSDIGPGPVTGTVKIEGIAVYGGTLTAVYDGEGTVLSYQWYCTPVGGTEIPIEGATSSEYTIGIDAGYMIRVSVTVSDDVGTLHSESVVVAAAQITGILEIDGSAAIGQKITASYDGNCTDPVFTWYKDGSEIATGEIYTVTAFDVGCTLMVAVTSESGNWSGAVYAYVGGSGSAVDPLGPGSDDDGYAPGDDGDSDVPGVNPPYIPDDDDFVPPIVIPDTDVTPQEDGDDDEDNAVALIAACCGVIAVLLLIVFVVRDKN